MGESFRVPLRNDGTIAYAFLDPDYKRRAEPADLLEVLHGLK